MIDVSAESTTRDSAAISDQHPYLKLGFTGFGRTTLTVPAAGNELLNQPGSILSGIIVNATDDVCFVPSGLDLYTQPEDQPTVDRLVTYAGIAGVHGPITVRISPSTKWLRLGAPVVRFGPIQTHTEPIKANYEMIVSVNDYWVSRRSSIDQSLLDALNRVVNAVADNLKRIEWLQREDVLSSGAAGTAVVAEQVPVEPPSHSVAAKNLRDMTGLSAGELAAMLGVSREAYQRWLGGGAIKGLNEEHLRYLYGLMAEGQRRIGRQGLSAWLRTPVHLASQVSETPIGLLNKGLFTAVHSLIVELPDPNPVVDGRYVALRKMLKEEEDES